MRKYVLVTLALTVVGLFAVNVAPAFACASYSPGYWMNHTEWSGGGIWVGGNWYYTVDALQWMQTPPQGDKSVTAFFITTAAALDVYQSWGDDRTAWFTAANAWVAANPPGSGVDGGSAAWQEIEPVMMLLDSTFE